MFFVVPFSIFNHIFPFLQFRKKKSVSKMMAFSLLFICIDIWLFISTTFLPIRADHLPQICIQKQSKTEPEECLPCNEPGIQCPQGLKCGQELNSNEIGIRRFECRKMGRIKRSLRGIGELPVCSTMNPGQLDCIGCNLLHCLPNQKCKQLINQGEWPTEFICQ